MTLFARSKIAPLTQALCHPIPTGQFRNRPTAQQQRGHIASILGLLNGPLDEPTDAVVMGEVTVNGPFGLFLWDSERCRKAIGADPIDDAKVYRLGCSAHLGDDLFCWKAEELHGGVGVNVMTFLEISNELFIRRQMSQDTQLNLVVVKGNEPIPFLSNEGLSDPFTPLTFNGNILKVRL